MVVLSSFLERMFSKGRSSRFLRQEFPALKRKLATLWTRSYFVSTVGGGTARRHQALYRESERPVDAQASLPVPFLSDGFAKEDTCSDLRMLPLRLQLGPFDTQSGLFLSG